MAHESGAYHVTGEAVFVDDMLTDERLLHGRVVYSAHAHAKINSSDISKAKKLKGVHAVLCYKDIPGENNIGPTIHDELCLAEKEVTFVGQAIFLIAAESEEIAIEAEKLISIKYEPMEAILDLETAIRKKSLLSAPRKIETGDVDKAIKNAAHVIKGKLETGAQEHWYLETQTCLCYPGEGKEIYVYSSTQHPTETQALVAEILDIPKNEVVVDMRRMGGAFGGKETQANHVACWAALLCWHTKRPAKIRLFRDDDQIMTGKRHPFLINYKVGFDDEGTILGIDVEQNSNAGAARDLSMAILNRAMFHAENAYYIPNMRIIGKAYRTNLPSNTAFRGFGGPQGMAGIETIIDQIARYLKEDPADIRHKNFYGLKDRNVTPYGQIVKNNRLYMIWDQLMKSSKYKNRKRKIQEF
ncbi:molybdopterin-dependent oxidoreductase, partial [Candidatus Amoebophilus asiaticus]|nr:molybdopterin-dependent oxidoreductase [Candidatus Amoebophilus asiaticus]